MAAGAYWPEASAKLTGDTYFAGGDLGSTIDLGNERVLLNLGDSYIRTAPGQARSSAKFVRNAVALQSGSYDLSQADLEFFVGGGGLGSSSPASFFPERAVDGGPVWNWVWTGLMVGTSLLLLATREENKPSNVFGFTEAGWDAILIDNPQDSPDDWQLNYLETPSELGFKPMQLMEGGDGWIYLFGMAAGNKVHAMRWDRLEAAAGQLMGAERWGRCGWQPWLTPGPWRTVYEPPDFGINDGSLVMRPNDFLFIQCPGFSGTASVGYSLSSGRVGAYPNLTPFYTPRSDDPHMGLAASNYVVYACLAHPEQTWVGKTDQDILITYVVGSAGSNTIFLDETTYYLRAAKATGLV